MLCFVHIFYIIIILLFSLKLYIKQKTKWCGSSVCLMGKTTIVTGANTGIGFETALDFAKRGARVILACRCEDKGSEARDKIIRASKNRNVMLRVVNFSSLSSVRSFAQQILEKEERLDILVNNAGAGGIGQHKTADGLELVMQINYFAPFLLTLLLMPLLKRTTSSSRIVNVASLAAKYEQLDPNSLNDFSGIYSTYAKSKLGNILFTRELAKRLQMTNVKTYSVHPGVVNTEIFRRAQGIFKYLFRFAGDMFFKTSKEGAQTTIYTAIAEEVEELSGEHFAECQRVAPYRSVMVDGLESRIWEETVNLLNIKDLDL